MILRCREGVRYGGKLDDIMIPQISYSILMLAHVAPASLSHR